MTRYVKASLPTYAASIGRIIPGQTYLVEDDTAERWINAGIATAGKKPPEPEPEPEPAPEDEEDDEEPAEEEEEHDDAERERLRAEAKRLLEAGDSQRAIAEKLGVSRSVVRTLLQAA